MLVSHYKQGNLDLDAFVTERITIDQVEEAFEKMHHGKVLRSVVEIEPAAGTQTAGTQAAAAAPAAGTAVAPV
jgi:S-(hydroxymethyl)mycothiol dehydrogenase